MLSDLVKKNRSYRRFDQSIAISTSELKELVSLARLSASGKNLQPLKYIISNNSKTNLDIFSLLKWAGYLEEWDGPKEGERPAAYIIVMLDKSISDNPFIDHGISVQSMLLGAVEKGFGGCIIAAFNKSKLMEVLNIDQNFSPLLVVALGAPKEKVQIIKLTDNNHRYFRDSDEIHYVPKRDLDEIIFDIKE